MSVIMHNNTTVTAVAKKSTTSFSSASYLEVIDPVNRTGKITVPMQYIQDTKGMDELTRPKDAKDLSLCLLFQKGRCNAGSRCHQIHAEPSFVEKLRNQANTGSSCCALHGDFNSSSYISAGLTVEVMTNGVATKYNLQSFGRTCTMDTMMSTAAGNYSKSVRMNVNKVCRLHAQSRCKFGKDCKNVHMCPNAKPIAPSASKQAAAVPAAPIAPLSGFARPTELPTLKSSGPLGSSTYSTATSSNNNNILNTTNRKMKSSPGLDVSRSELATSCTSFGLSTCPNTPSDMTQSTRSLSVESSASNPGLSPIDSVTPTESPKQHHRLAAAATGLFNRNVVCVSPAPIAETPVVESLIPQPNFTRHTLPPTTLSSFANTDDAIVYSKTSSSSSSALSGLNVSELVAVIWEKPLQTQSVGSEMSPLACDGFEQTMSLLAKDLTGLSCSPSWAQ